MSCVCELALLPLFFPSLPEVNCFKTWEDMNIVDLSKQIVDHIPAKQLRYQANWHSGSLANLRRTPHGERAERPLRQWVARAPPAHRAVRVNTVAGPETKT